MNNYAQPYFSNPMPYYQPMYQPKPQPNFLQGKSVDSIDVVKAMDIPLDGSISYFPLIDGTGIITKQLQQDGTTKTIIFKPITEEAKEMPKYITAEELDKAIKGIDLDSLVDDLDDLKQEIKELKKKKKEE